MSNPVGALLATVGKTGAPLRAPSDSVEVQPGTIQAEVNSHAGGTSFLLIPGAYSEGPITPKEGDRFFGQGEVFWDGRWRQQAAFTIAGASGVVVSGIHFSHFKPPNQGNGLFGLNSGESNFLLEGCEIADNRGTPVSVGNGTRLVNNSIHDNYWVGIGGYQVASVNIEHNEVYNNYLAKISPDSATGDAAGLKFVKSDRVTISNNFIHNNYGVGVWFDTDNTRTVINGNIISDNSYRAIMEEVSYGAVISYNTISRNGRLSGWISGAGLLISTASNVEASYNIVDDNYDGIVGFQQQRGSGPHGTYATTHNRIHDNYVIMTRGVTGLTMGAEENNTNQFFNNHYCLGGNSTFMWGQNVSIAQWQGAGQDKMGTFDDCAALSSKDRRSN